MAIRITPRGEELRCPYCHDSLEMSGVACPACRAAYHEECAAIFGRCAILGCGGRFEAAGVAQLLPRLGALARRLGGAWDVETLDPHGPHAVVLQPCDRFVQQQAAAARAVGDLLGPAYSPYDGRLRLQTPFPEPLVRFEGRDGALEACRRLGERKIPATVLPLRELVRPLERFDVRAAALGDPIVLRDREGRLREYGAGAPRLVVQARGIETRSMPKKKTMRVQRGRYGSATISRQSFSSDTQQRSQLVTFVLGEGDPTPALIEAHQPLCALERGGESDRRVPWAALADALKRGAEVHEIRGANSPILLSLLALGSGTHSPEVRSNLGGLQLVVRILAHEWRARRRGTRRPEKG